MSRLYIVTDKETSKQHLVEADSQPQSVGVVVGERYESRAASALDAAKLLQAGTPLMQAPKRAPKEPNLPEAKAEQVTNAVEQPVQTVAVQPVVVVDETPLPALSPLPVVTPVVAHVAPIVPHNLSIGPAVAAGEHGVLSAAHANSVMAMVEADKAKVVLP